MERALLDHLGRSERAPGVVLPLLEALHDDSSLGRDRVRELASACREEYADDPWSLGRVNDVLVALTDPAEHQVLALEQVDAFRRLANESDGIQRLLFLQQAAEAARLAGASSVADELRVEIEGLGPDDLALRQLEVGVNVDASAIEGHIAWLVGSDGLESALARLGSVVPSGSQPDNREFIEELRREHPLSSIFPTRVLGPANSVLVEVGAEDSLDHELTQHEARSAAFYSTLLPRAIRGIIQKYGPDLETLGNALTCDVVDASAARGIARATLELCAGEADVAGHLLAPRLERVIRSWVQSLGIPVTTDATGRRVGGVRGLGSLISALNGHIDESWRRYLRAVFDPRGLNLRNRILHGLVDEVDETAGGLMIHIACAVRFGRLTG